VHDNVLGSAQCARSLRVLLDRPSKAQAATSQ
jgi:hypothetical protein